MGLKMIIGASGTGKSEYVYKMITEEATRNKDTRYFVIVPDQFTMQTQMDMVLHSTNKAIMNIDVLSFSRLAHRIFEETNAVGKLVLDDTGKSLILRKIVEDMSEEVPYLAGNLKRIGFIHEIKSSISEFMQYGIGREQLEQLIDYSSTKGALKAKLTDLSVLYGRFTDYIKDSYITTEESMDLLATELTKSGIIKDSVVVFDGFTGFTPVQMKVLLVLMKLCKCVYVTFTLDADKKDCGADMQELFSFTAKSYASVCRLAEDNGIDVENIEGFDINYRFRDKPDLSYLERKIFRNLARDDSYEDIPEHIALYEGRDIKDEVSNVAYNIRQLVANGAQYRDIAVVSGNLGDYENHVIREFEAYDIPVYMDKTRGLILNPFVEYTKSMLQIIKKNFDSDSVLRFLRTGMSGIDSDKIDIFENYCMKSGLRGRSSYENFADRREERLAKQGSTLTDKQKNELDITLEVTEKIIDVLSPVLEAGIKSTSKRKTADYVEAVYNCLVKVNAFSVLKQYEERFRQEGNFTKEKEYSQIYRLTVELLEQIHELLGEEAITLDEFTDILEAGFEEITVGTIPQSVDKVIVGDIERSRLKPVKYVFFMGLNDNNIPKRGGKTSILSDMEREYLADNGYGLELSPTPHQKMFIQRFYLYSNLVKPSEKLFLSFSDMGNDGKSLRGAYIIAMIKQLFPKLECTRGENDKSLDKLSNTGELKEYICDLIRKNGERKLDESEHADLMKAMSVLAKLDGGNKDLLEMFIENSFYKYSDKKLDGMIAGILYGETLLASISRMEKFAECAYSYFLRYGLSLKERESYHIDNREMGTIFHDTLKRYGECIAAQGLSWIDISEEQANEILDKELMNVCRETELLDGKVNNYIYKRVAKVLHKAVDILAYQLRAGRYSVSELEVAFSRQQTLDEVNVALDVQEKMKLNGRIDRIDTMDMGDKIYVKVIDYKTGKKEFSLLNFYHGLQLQLVVYLAEGVRQIERKNKGKEVLPGALLYYRVADETVDGDSMDSEEKINARIRDSLKTKGLITAEDDNIAGIAGITSGKSDVVPISFNKDNSLSKNSAVMSLEDMQLLGDYAQYKLRNIGDDIIAGKITCNPIKEDENRNSCTYCEFKSVCGFEEKLEGYTMASLKKIDDVTLLDMMKKEMEEE